MDFTFLEFAKWFALVWLAFCVLWIVGAGVGSLFEPTCPPGLEGEDKADYEENNP